MSTTTPEPRPHTSPLGVEVPAGIRVIGSQLRSTNLERDIEVDQLGPLYVGARAQDTLGRFVAAVEDPARPRAWSLTGPYGSGKSTLALLIDALFGPKGGRRTQADRLVAAVNPDLARRIEDARASRASAGFIRAIATARREPLAMTLTRALLTAGERRWPSTSEMPPHIATALGELRRAPGDSAQLLHAVKALSSEDPLLLIIDEFGKTLEHLSAQDDPSDPADDLYLLQELTECGAGPTGLPLYVLTLQHLSFLDYAVYSATLQRREWAKVQGRFEDLNFSPDVGDAVQLLGRSLDHSRVSESGRRLIHRHADTASHAWTQHGLEGVLPGDAQLFAGLYPLHPLTAVAAPLLAAQVGQHDRTLTGFLAGDEPHTVSRFLAEHVCVEAAGAGTVRLPQLYDYFLGSGRTTLLASPNASRWIEIDARISEAHGLAEADVQVLKTVGLLNLIDSSGALRASREMVLFALNDPPYSFDEGNAHATADHLAQLVDRGFLVYRDFSDEYRLWQGSDVDLRARIDEAREQYDDHALVDMLAEHLPAAVIAGKHSQRTGMLRHFRTKATGPNHTQIEGPGVEDAADGLLVFHLGNERDVPTVTSPLPVVVGISDQADVVLDRGRYFLALEELGVDKSLDAVASREVTERAGEARAELTRALADIFDPTHPRTRWYLLQPGDSQDNQIPGRELHARSLASLVSDACDHRYKQTPAVRNEMLGRHQLTSQGAKARRELLTAMITHPTRKALGIEGYGPQHAMYSGVLSYLGLHHVPRKDTGHGTESVEAYFTEPKRDHPLYPAWEALGNRISAATTETPVNDLFRLLMAPPYGVKAGVVPIVILAALILKSDEIVLFEEGSYQPRLTSDLVERFTKTPDRFSFKSAPTTRGQQRLVLDELATALGLRISASAHSHAGVRNPALLKVTRALLDHVRDLTPHARRTHRLSPTAIAVRDALATARDPHNLVFAALPTAVGIQATAPETPRDTSESREYATRLMSALDEIRRADDSLREEVVEILARQFDLPDDLTTLRKDLAAKVRGLAEVSLEPALNGLVTLALNNTIPDEDWLDPIAVRVVNVGLNDWTDDHITQFTQRARELARALDRVSHLADTEQINQDGEVFHARIVTLTGRDGHEDRALVHVPQRVQETATQFAHAVIDQAEQKLGSGGGRVLLAALAQRLIDSQADEPSPRVESTPSHHEGRKVSR